ncbi:MAG TPA: MOSC domain-containing protein [Ilumatobacteraceae bacterium]
MEHSIGPYRFNGTDAKRTVQFGDEIFDLYSQGRDASVIEHLRPRSPTGDLVTDLESVWTAWTSAGPALRAAGQLPERAEGSVAQLSVSSGGVPKLPVHSAEVDWSGMVGDRQATRVHHGRPWQALCIWSEDVIEDFRRAGHPIAPGRAGENITIAGLDWADVRPGVRLLIGDVLCEVSAYALPCASNKPWFINGDFTVMHHERGPVSRVYATVLAPGRVTVGDPAILEPGDASDTSR